jgi:hypothetical protein
MLDILDVSLSVFRLEVLVEHVVELEVEAHGTSSPGA